MTSAANEPASKEQQEIFGHPKGLTFLFATEMWERFSYYGMRSLLVLYMVHHLLQPERAQNVIGYATLKSILELLFGPLGVQPFASHIYGFYTAFVYLTPILGGLIAGEIISLTSMVNPGYAYIMLFAAMTLVLMVRPHGLLGVRGRE